MDQSSSKQGDLDYRPLSIYLHIPFCVQKCAYCDFLSAPATPLVRDAYVDRLCEEIHAGIPMFPPVAPAPAAAVSDASVHAPLPLADPDPYMSAQAPLAPSTPGLSSGSNGAAMPPLATAIPLPHRVVSVFFGGGTPSILEGSQILKIMTSLRDTFSLLPDAEITMECNPGTLDSAKLDAYRAAGINRLSLGLQSADNRQLKLLGRIHTWETFLESWHLARRFGFSNLNVDLMSSLPGQTPSSWEDTLKSVLALGPEHLSAYSLIIEEGTAFYEKYHTADALRARGEVQSLLPSEEEEREMYYLTRDLLEQSGMHRYEISNYALPGFESIHNCGYWLRRDYAGFGLGAASLIDNVRYNQTSELQVYLKRAFPDSSQSPASSETSSRASSGLLTPSGAAVPQVQYLSRREQIEETMFLGLRMMSGIDLDRFEQTFGERAEKLYRAEIDKGIAQGLLAIAEGHLRLTDRGIDLSNYVLSSFLMEDS